MSVASRVHGIVATPSGMKPALWEIFGGTIHRVVDFQSEIVAMAFDEEFGVWVATEKQGHLISVGGETWVELIESVICLSPLQLHR
jgi:hypothetical protein